MLTWLQALLRLASLRWLGVFICALATLLSAANTASALEPAQTKTSVWGFDLAEHHSVGLFRAASSGKHQGNRLARAEEASGSLLAARAALRFGANDLVYGPSAKGALRQLQQSAGGRLLTDVGGPGAGQSWAQFSIQTLEKQVAAGGRIRFELSHVDDLAGVLKGTGSHAGTVTAQELRFLQANWGRFSGNTNFYRGGAEVAAPW